MGPDRHAQDFLVFKKGHTLTVHALGAVIELTGQNDAPFPNKQRKRNSSANCCTSMCCAEKTELYGFMTYMCRVDVVRLSGSATAPSIVRTSTTDRASEYIEQLLRCTAAQLGNTYNIYLC